MVSVLESRRITQVEYRVPVRAFCCYRVCLQRKKCCQQIIGLHDESFSIAVCIAAKKKSVLGEVFGDAVRLALRM